MMKFRKMNQKYNNDKKEKKKENNNNEDKIKNKLNENKENENKIVENKTVENKILENNKNENQNIKEENENNNDDKNKIENEGNNENDKNNDNEQDICNNNNINNNNNDSLNQINIFKKIDSNNNIDNDNNIINNEEIKKEDKKIKFNNNLHSPDMEIRGGNKSKKKYIKVKYSKAMTSKTSIGSIKSEGKSNNSSIQTKKMRIKNVEVNPSDYLANFLINNNIHNKNVNPNSIKLIKLIDKVESKTLVYKYFKSWKKIKNES